MKGNSHDVSNIKKTTNLKKRHNLLDKKMNYLKNSAQRAVSFK